MEGGKEVGRGVGGEVGWGVWKVREKGDGRVRCEVREERREVRMEGRWEWVTAGMGGQATGWGSWRVKGTGEEDGKCDKHGCGTSSPAELSQGD